MPKSLKKKNNLILYSVIISVVAIGGIYYFNPEIIDDCLNLNQFLPRQSIPISELQFIDEKSLVPLAHTTSTLPTNSRLTWAVVDAGHPETTELLLPLINKVLKKHENFTALEFTYYWDLPNPKSKPSIIGGFQDSKYSTCTAVPCDIDIGVIWIEQGVPHAGTIGQPGWGSIYIDYRQPNTRDTEQIIQHEIGHVLGLGHLAGTYMEAFFVIGEEIDIFPEPIVEHLQTIWGVPNSC